MTQSNTLACSGVRTMTTHLSEIGTTTHGHHSVCTPQGCLRLCNDGRVELHDGRVESNLPRHHQLPPRCSVLTVPVKCNDIVQKHTRQARITDCGIGCYDNDHKSASSVLHASLFSYYSFRSVTTKNAQRKNK